MEAPPTNPYSTPVANLYGAPAGGAADAVSPSTIAMLAGTKPWVRFLSVLMWISIGFMLLGAASIGVLSAIGASKSGAPSPFGGKEMIVIAVVYGILAFVYIFPAVKLWKYASRIGTLGSTRSVADLDAALKEQRSFWKFIGVMAIILISLYLIFIIAAVVFGATAAMRAGALPH
jgi:Family of unknown function (DUF5362)